MRRLALLVLLVTLFLTQSSHAITESGAKKEILDLTTQISNALSNNTVLHEKYYKHKMAQQQADLLILTVTDRVYRYHGGKKKYKDINEFVKYAFESSFIFTKLGDNHLDIFEMYLRWAQAETGFDPRTISKWKKGQSFQQKKVNSKGVVYGKRTVTVKFNNQDYGILQINSRNIEFVKPIVIDLYMSGVVPYKVKRIKTGNDLLDIKTNIVARSIIETDRKERGWDYKHYRHHSVDFTKKLRMEIYKLSQNKLYDKNLVQGYYHLIPVKTYE